MRHNALQFGRQHTQHTRRDARKGHGWRTPRQNLAHERPVLRGAKRRSSRGRSRRAVETSRLSLGEFYTTQAGMKSRLRDAAAIRELAPIREDARHDALRAVFGAVNDMLVKDEAKRVLKVRDLTITVLLEDV